MNCGQQVVSFHCQGSSMIGIIDLPERPLPRGVLVVAGQPHSRLGESRQYAMLARALARRGITVMRFDRRGVGDSEGCSQNDNDVLAALREFGQRVPALRDIVLLGPASNAALQEALVCAADEEQICGLILLETSHANQRGGRRKGFDEPAILRALAESATLPPAASVRASSLYLVPAPSLPSPATTSPESAAQQGAAYAARPAAEYAPQPVAQHRAHYAAQLAAPVASSAHVPETRHAPPNWRRARNPRRRTTAEQRLTALVAQLCAFPGPVLLIAAPQACGTLDHADTSSSVAAAASADMQAALSRLVAMVARHCPERRIDIVCAANSAEAGGLRDSDGPGRGGLTDICANWLVSW